MDLRSRFPKTSPSRIDSHRYCVIVIRCERNFSFIFPKESFVYVVLPQRIYLNYRQKSQLFVSHTRRRIPVITSRLVCGYSSSTTKNIHTTHKKGQIPILKFTYFRYKAPPWERIRVRLRLCEGGFDANFLGAVHTNVKKIGAADKSSD